MTEKKIPPSWPLTQAEILKILDVVGTLAQMGAKAWHAHVMEHVSPGLMDPLPEEPRPGQRRKKFENSPIQTRIVWDLAQYYRMVKAPGGQWEFLHKAFLEEGTLVFSTDSFLWRDWKKMPSPRMLRKAVRALKERGILEEVDMVYRNQAYRAGQLIPELNSHFLKKVDEAVEKGQKPPQGGKVHQVRINWDKVRDELLYVGPRRHYPKPTHPSETIDGRNTEAGCVEKLLFVQCLSPESTPKAMDYPSGSKAYFEELATLLVANAGCGAFRVIEMTFTDMATNDGMSPKEKKAYLKQFAEEKSLQAKAFKIAQDLDLQEPEGSVKNPTKRELRKGRRRWFLRDLALLGKDLFPSTEPSLIAFDPEKKDFVRNAFSADQTAALHALLSVPSVQDGDRGVHIVIIPPEVRLSLFVDPNEVNYIRPGDTTCWELNVQAKGEEFDAHAFFRSIKARIPSLRQTGDKDSRYTTPLFPHGPSAPAVDTGVLEHRLNRCCQFMGQSMRIFLESSALLEGHPHLPRNRFASRYLEAREALCVTSFKNPLQETWDYAQQDPGIWNPLTQSLFKRAVHEGLRAEHIRLYKSFVTGNHVEHKELFDLFNDWSQPWMPSSMDVCNAGTDGTLHNYLVNWKKWTLLAVYEYVNMCTELVYRQLVVYEKYVQGTPLDFPRLQRLYEAISTVFSNNHCPMMEAAAQRAGVYKFNLTGRYCSVAGGGQTVYTPERNDGSPFVAPGFAVSNN